MEFICHIRLKKKNLSSSLVCKSNINTKATHMISSNGKKWLENRVGKNGFRGNLIKSIFVFFLQLILVGRS
jgi:hypothetical protein